MNEYTTKAEAGKSVIYIRPLHLQDAHTSYQWRNNPKIWKFTGSRPDREITYEIEAAWLADVLKRDNERRFAICDSATDKYIGNVFLTDIDGSDAHIHIFIGEIDFWGSGRANEAVRQVHEYGFNVLNLNNIYCEINQRNSASRAVAQAAGYIKVDEHYDEARKMTLVKSVLTKTLFNSLSTADTLQNT